MERRVSAILRTSSWVDSGMNALARSNPMISIATASSTSVKPCGEFRGRALSGGNDDHPVIDAGGDTGTVLENIVAWRGVLAFQVVAQSGRWPGHAGAQ